MSSLYDVLDDYGLAENEKATKLVESLLEALSDLAGTEEPAAKPKAEQTACVGTYATVDGKSIVVAYDLRWMGILDSSYPLHGYEIQDGDIAQDNWTKSGRFLESCAGDDDDDDLVIPEGHVHVHYITVESANCRPGYPKSVSSYSGLSPAREDNCQNLPILRITYRDNQIISAQLVNDWETS